MRTDDITVAMAALFDPRSVAIVGASDKTGKWGNVLAQTIIKGSDRREVFFVNQQGGSVLGKPAFRSLAELPTTPELAVIVVPERHFDDPLNSALSMGSKAIVAISALDSNDPAREADIRQRIRTAGAVMLGPNCMGVIDTKNELSAAAHLTLNGGDVALISQSGGLGMEMGNRAQQLGIGFSRFISLGNQLDLTAVDFIRDLATHDETRVIALYLEHLGEGRDLRDVCLLARSNGKQVVLLAPGRSTATQRAAKSHTGSLAGDDQAISALCRSAGITRVSTPRELLEAAAALRYPRLPAGKRVAIISDGGGAAVVASDLVGRIGFSVPEFSKGLSKSLAEGANALASLSNPLDLLADDPDTIARSVRRVAASAEVDAIVVTGVFGSTAAKEYPPELGDLSHIEQAEVEAAREIANFAKASAFPIVASTIASRSPVIVELASAGVPMYGSIEAAVAALNRLHEAAMALPEQMVATGKVEDPIIRGDYEFARSFLAERGVAFPTARFVETIDEARAAAADIGFPIALKAVGLLHKSDQGGVALNIRDFLALELAFEKMASRISERPFSIERMAAISDGVEVIVGTRLDEQLGPLVMVGLGGIFTETLRDVQTALAPASPATMRRLFESLKGADIFKGLRGRPTTDMDALANLAAKLSQVAAVHPEIQEMELNPVLALADGALALDARIILADQAAS